MRQFFPKTLFAGVEKVSDCTAGGKSREKTECRRSQKGELVGGNSLEQIVGNEPPSSQFGATACLLIFKINLKEIGHCNVQSVCFKICSY